MPDRTVEQERMLARMRTFRDRFVKAQENLTEMEKERTRLYEQARDLDPPVTFRDIAAVFGCSEAAVMQKLKKGTR